MKKTFKLIMIAAAICAVSISCVKEETGAENSVVNDKVNITITAGNELADTDTKTVYDPVERTISWGNQATEKLTVFELLSNGTLSNVTANCTSVTEGKATFNAQFTALPEETDLTYFAVYPETAWSYWVKETNINRVPARIEDTQKPTLTSFDPKFDFLFSRAEKKDAQPTDIDFSFGRVVALVKINFTNLPAGKVHNVTLTANGKDIKGMLFVDVANGVLTNEAIVDAGSKITLDYSDQEAVIADGKFTAWFCTLPFVMEEGDYMSLAIKYDNNSTYSRTLTAPAGGLEFNMGKIRPINVDMTSAEHFWETEVVCTSDNMKWGEARIEGEWIKGLREYYAGFAEFNVNVPAAGTYYMYNEVNNWDETYTKCYVVTVNEAASHLYVARSGVHTMCHELYLNEGSNTIKIGMQQDWLRLPYTEWKNAEWLPDFKNSFIFASAKLESPFYQVIRPSDCQLENPATPEEEIKISDSEIEDKPDLLYANSNGGTGFKFMINIPKDGTYLFEAETNSEWWGWNCFNVIIDDNVASGVICTYNVQANDIHFAYSRLMELPEGEHWITIRPVWTNLNDLNESIANGTDNGCYIFPDFYSFAITEW